MVQRSTQGGAITLSNVNPITEQGQTTASVQPAGIRLLMNTSINAQGGDINISGMSNQAGAMGIELSRTTLSTSNNGKINLIGSNSASTAPSQGISIGVSIVGGSVSTEKGSILLKGASITGRAVALGDGTTLVDNKYPDNKIYSASGHISLIGISESTIPAASIGTGKSKSYIGWDGTDTHKGTTGDLTFQGQDGGASGRYSGMDLSFARIKGNGGALIGASVGKGIANIGIPIESGSIFSRLSVGDSQTYDSASVGTGSMTINGPVNIQAGGMYNGSMISIHTRAGVGGNLNSTGPINILAGHAVPLTDPKGNKPTYSTAPGSIYLYGVTLNSGGGDHLIQR